MVINCEPRGVRVEEIKSYRLIDSKRSSSSAVIRGGIGAIALGPVGLLAAATAKKKYSVLLIMKDGSNQFVKMDEYNLKRLMENVC